MTPDDDARTLRRMGYAQELARCLGGFSNFAISLSIICVLAGGLTSFHVGFCSVGGVAVGVGWPLMCLLSLAVAATMGQVASAFPTAGGLYHWASVLGGRGWGWATAWFNLAGLVTVLAAINVGTFRFAAAAFDPAFDAADPAGLRLQFLVVALMTASQAAVNHLGIRVTRVLTDFSGWWILAASAALTLALLAYAPSLDFVRLLTVTNYSGEAGGNVWPETGSLALLFTLGLLLPAYTITGFDASAHAAEETVHAADAVPRGIVRSVLVSGVAGWVMLCAVVLAMPDPDAAAVLGEKAFAHTLTAAVPGWLATALFGAAVVAQYLCGLATVTSASRMAFAFARDGGMPFHAAVRWVSPRFQTPPVAVWGVAVAAVAFTAYTPVYTTITAVCVIFLYVSYVVPTAIGLLAHGRWWTAFGPWTLGIWYRPLAVVSVVACVGLIVVGVQPPNDQAAYVVLGMVALLTVGWFGHARRTFPGPPRGVLTGGRDE
ncbi:amino acid permease [Urbifossiella limnaea]|uniref:Putative amino acid permease YhdG n=1 Tax=Urbifossiella limnaea TaxID=2528023 RepID=A0A517Y0Z0_9BACT|nr:amino acid permease [Urbifossiella limnaea]QDU23421.1 putative amino acid permease YhdG [Urbifossiella limnaea]